MKAFAGFIAALMVLAATALAAAGDLTPAGCIAARSANPAGCKSTARGLGGALSVAASPDGRSVYVAGSSDNAIVTFKRTAGGGMLSAQSCIAASAHNPAGCGKTARGLRGAAAVAVSADGRSVYVASPGDNAIVAFKRNTSSGTLTPQACIADRGHNPAGCASTARGLRSPLSVAVTADGSSIYVTGSADSAIVAFKRNVVSGALTAMGCIAATAHNPAGCTKTARGLWGAFAVAVSTDGRSVYVAGEADNALVVFKRNAGGGALTPQGCIADRAHNPAGCGQKAGGLDNAQAVAVSADGRSVYTLGAGPLGSPDQGIVELKRDTGSGALTPKGCIAEHGQNPDGCAKTTYGLQDVVAVTVSADGKSVYTAAWNDMTVVHFRRNTMSGALQPRGCIGPSFSSGCAKSARGLDSASSVTVSEDGKSLYATGFSDNAIVSFRRAP